MSNYILAFESSCDDTAAAVIDDKYNLCSNVVGTQVIHDRYGGVVPEIASREHVKTIMSVAAEALRQAKIETGDIDAVAVSNNPGLIGSLIVGLSFAKGLAWSLGVPLITVNHMQAHIEAVRLTEPELSYPYLALVVSGGHTELVWFQSAEQVHIAGRTLDDAAGEAFDKVAKLLGLGYPGGPRIEKAARDGNPDFVRFPRGLRQKGNYNFSFSGLKTAVSDWIRNQGMDLSSSLQLTADVAAAFQASVIDSLASKTFSFARSSQIPTVILAGGVAANRTLRDRFIDEGRKWGIRVIFPEIRFCTDNAAMVAAAAIPLYRKRLFSPLTVNASSRKGTVQSSKNMPDPSLRKKKIDV